MAGVTKECKICKGMFTTRSIKSAVWELKCHVCYSSGRRTHFENKNDKKVETMEASLQKQINTLHAKVTDIDMLIAAEISNHFNNITDAEMLNRMTDSVLELVAGKVSDMEANLFSFQEKIQKQLVALNNRMISMFNDLND